MPSIFSAESSKVRTSLDAISRLLQQGVVLETEQEIMWLADHCFEVFVACGYQLPDYLAMRLTDCRCPLDSFMDYAFEMLDPIPPGEFAIN